MQETCKNCNIDDLILWSNLKSEWLCRECWLKENIRSNKWRFMCRQDNYMKDKMSFHLPPPKKILN